jgi:hypothetical protein
VRENIETLGRYGGIVNDGMVSYEDIDNLVYLPLPDMNQIQSIHYAITDVGGKFQGYKYLNSSDYAYDPNCNMTIDPVNATYAIYSFLNSLRFNPDYALGYRKDFFCIATFAKRPSIQGLFFTGRAILRACLLV